MVKSVEVCVNSFESAVAAQKGGADRVELCSVLPVGGVTPSYGMIRCCKDYLEGVDINVLIRPRSGDFCYNRYEIDEIRRDIEFCGELGLNGVVIGALTPDGNVDMKLCAELIDLARKYALSVTFHRAIDRAADIYRALDDVIELGADRILTSGGAVSAPDGCETLRNMVIQAAGRINIMAGAGIRPDNVGYLVQKTGVPEVHLSATVSRESQMRVVTGPDFGKDQVVTVTDTEVVRCVVNEVKNV